MIYIRKVDGVSFTVDATNCDGSNEAISTATQCSIPITTLRAGAFQLPWGSGIYAKVLAYNLYGDSDESAVGNGAVILTFPDPQINLQEEIAYRSATSITFSWSLGAANGGAEVLDFRIYYEHTNGEWLILASEVSTQQYTATGLTAG